MAWTAELSVHHDDRRARAAPGLRRHRKPGYLRRPAWLNGPHRRRRAATVTYTTRGVHGYVPSPRRFYGEFRGVHRIFNAAVYRYYHSTDGPPLGTDAPFATSVSQPHQPAETFADGVHFFSVDRFNGVLSSGFLPIGPRGEPYIRMDVDAVQIGSPPLPPTEWHIEPATNGAVRVVGLYVENGPDRATEWAITHTDDLSEPGEPPAVSPTVTVPMSTLNVSLLDYLLPAQGAGTYRVRVQVRKFVSPSWVYSEGSRVESLTALSIGGIAGFSEPLDADTWPGRLPGGG